MNEKQIKLNVSWVVPWVAGFLFTWGFVELSVLEIKDTGDTIAAILLFFFGWPLILGDYLGGIL